MSGRRISIEIAGSKYTVNTDEDDSYIKQLASELDADIKNVLTANDSATVTAASVVCALDYLDRCTNIDSGADNMRSQISSYIQEKNAALAEADRLRAQLEAEKRSAAADENTRIEELNNQLIATLDELTDASRDVERLKNRVLELEGRPSDGEQLGFGMVDDALAMQLRDELTRTRAESDEIIKQLRAELRAHQAGVRRESVGEAQSAEMAEKLKKAEEESFAYEQKFLSLSAELASEKQRIFAFDEEREELNKQLTDAARRADELQSELTAAQAELAELHERDSEKELEEMKLRMQAFESESAAVELEQLRREYDMLKQDTAPAARIMEQQTGEIQRLSAALAEAESEILRLKEEQSIIEGMFPGAASARAEADEDEEREPEPLKNQLEEREEQSTLWEETPSEDYASMFREIKSREEQGDVEEKHEAEEKFDSKSFKLPDDALERISGDAAPADKSEKRSMFSRLFGIAPDDEPDDEDDEEEKDD